MDKHERAAKEFEKLGEKLIKDAEAIKCDIEDFVEGLRDIEIQVRERREMEIEENEED